MPQARRLFCYLQAMLLLLLLPQVSVAGTEYTLAIESAPAWVQVVEASTPDNIPVEEIGSGNYYLLVDNQLKLDESSPQVRFTRLRQLVVNQRGLDKVSQIEVDFDPLYESLTFHSMQIIRHSEVIDKLSDPNISLLKQEGRIEQGLYDGRLTAHIILDDVRVGDIIEYSYSISGANPVYQNIFSFQRALQWSFPIHVQSLRVLWGKKHPLYVDVKNMQDTVIKRKLTIDNDAYIEYVIVGTYSPILIRDSNTPSWYNPFATVYFSELNSWEQVVDWAIPLYSQRSVAGEEVSRVIKDIKLQTRDPNKRVMLALNYVQEQIRYLGLEMGVNSHQPSLAEDTLSRRYGDCKDKVMLFIALLNGLDISAYPVLVNTDYGHDLLAHPVSLNAFNHVIAKVQVFGLTYWLDPTMNYQKGPLEDIFQANYHHGLVIKPGESDLTALRLGKTKSLLTLTESYDVSAGFKGRASLSVKSRYQGERAQSFRYQLEDIGLKALQTSYEDYYRKDFSGIKLANKLIIDDNGQTGVVNTQEAYQIDNAWQPDGADFNINFVSYSIQNALEKPTNSNRQSPFSTRYPNKITHKIHIKVSNGDWQFPNETITESNPYFIYNFTSNFDDAEKTLTLTFNYESKVEYIAAMNVGDYISSINKIEDSLYYSVMTYGEGSTPAVSETSVSESVVGDTLDKKDKLILLCVLLYSLGLIYAIVTWRFDSKSRLEYPDEKYYPVSRRKLFFLSLSTGGLYISYWMYRNWKYINQTEQLGIMPIARGIFSPFWYYGLFSHLVDDSKERYSRNRIMPMSFGVVAAIIFFIANYAYNSDDWYLAGVLATPILLFPLINYIIKLNGRNSEAYIDNSAWKIRHTVVSLLFIPWILFDIGSDLTVFPSGKIMSGGEVWQSNIDFMNDNKIIKENEDILMFYSDGVISYEEDGNGFTDSSVFSYWEEDGELKVATADFVDVRNLKVEFGEDLDQQTRITVLLNDDSDFLLIVSTEDKLDLKFYQSLRKHWYQTKQLAVIEDKLSL
ncbi:transglutaminase-like enzyme, predicted cysteine protease [Shewanella psychrophila]|uniref:Transglutaminase-like enzyme, predicted cysteine protease n=2 Tax=Shewanella psychrophila TaxID=225848 RepID=A0A1S6HQQ8_9GAMM|nr:transglutaminase-like enzyme, predicted cysteine protease [Shewanella psychrophila]